MSAKKGIGELLVRENLVSLEQLEQARRDQKEQGKGLMTALVRKGFIQDAKLVEFLGQQYGLPTIDLNNFEIDSEAIKLISRQVCEKHCIIPVSRSGRSLVVAFSDPTNIFVKDDLSLLTRCKIEIVVAPEYSILSAIDRYYQTKSDMANIMSEIEDDDDIVAVDQSTAQAVDEDANADDGPIVKFVNAMLVEAIKLRASDIHMEPYEKRFRVRFRIDGVLHEKTQPPQGAASSIISRLKILCKMDIAERRRPQDGRLKVHLKNGTEIDFRVNSLPTLFGEKMVLRLLDKSNLQVDLRKLGFEADQLKVFKETIHLPQGMVLVTGPTGSGKTTTLYSGLAELNTPQQNISTAENPVEFNLDGVNQVQINPEINFNFSDALKSFLRQDPEIIMVGEIRDYETAEIAYKAASTGHLVMSTLHTNDAASTVTRLVDMGIAPYVVAEATTMVLAQRLMKKVCQNCMTDVKIKPEILIDLGVPPNEVEEYNQIKKGQGCDRCNGTGLSGRVAIYEILEMTAAIREAIFDGASPLVVKRTAIEKSGMKSLRQSALIKLKEGLTTVGEVLNSSVRDDV